MTWAEALETNISRTGHQKYRRLCDESHPRHILWRAEMVRMASPQLPSVPEQIANAAGAVFRLGMQFLTGGPMLVQPDELDRRLAICQPCEFFAGSRCTKCGCFGKLKARLESETGKCPEKKW